MFGNWSGPAEAASVGRLRNALAEFAADGGLTGLRLSDVRTCVSEAVTNAVVHGYRDGRQPRTINVSGELGEDDLMVTVSDDGAGFAPRLDSPGLGLGLPMISALTSSMSILASASGGTEVCMAFRLAGAR
ncbi:MAG TPA: ATP-binding protein [Solirubrobacter sp.]|nr:ATP-binding protein [Solirubrobacter sp.]